MVWATHNRAGEIVYEQIGNLRIRATIITYTKASSIDADRDTLILLWGDGSFNKVARANGNGRGVVIGFNTRYNIYVAEHTYPSQGTYTMSMTDPNRNAGVINVNPPNSENIPFYIETTFTFLNNTFQGFNSSPRLLQPPVDFGCVSQPFSHNPNAFDIDGDSLVYELIVPMQGVGSVVPNYIFPDQILPGSLNVLTLDSETGDLLWASPRRAGEYNIAMRIHEYRQGVLINSMIRDMQILIENCDNRPPTITAPSEICVIAGETITFDVVASDPDPGQRVKLTALGGPFIVAENKAVFSVPPGFETPPVTGTFSWTPSCNEISKQPYSVVFKVVDDINDSTGLALLHTTRITVSGPPPENLTGVSLLNQIRLQWDDPYNCDMTNNDFFRGFNIWRRISSNSFEVDTCRPTMEGKGYTKIAFGQKATEGLHYFYVDETAEKGKAYCYRVEAEFAKSTASGFPYNAVTSIPSNEVCLQLNLDIPLITKVSVESTASEGDMFISWVKPRIPDFDTLAHSGPYTYQLSRGVGFNPTTFTPLPGAVFQSQHFLDPVDTSYLDVGINTLGEPYSYVVDFLTGASNTYYGSSTTASSVYLNVSGSDKKTILSWHENVPWSNTQFVIYKLNPAGDFDSIAITQSRVYEDIHLENGREYCYKVKAIGSYGLSALPSPLINFSQVNCAIPIDTVPPCAPVLVVTNDCNQQNTVSELTNKLSWNNPDAGCGGIKDTEGYKVYYFAPGSTVAETILETHDPWEQSFVHFSESLGLAGCYVVVAFDSLGNESLYSNRVCMVNCPDYRLPNAFSPNGDGHNEVFKPYPYRFVSRVDFRVFNRWGNLIFRTENPDILWDGRTTQGKEVTDGVYYYTCQVFEQVNEEGLPPNPVNLSGYIEIIR